MGAQVLDFLDAKIFSISDDGPLNITYQKLDKMNDTFYLLAILIWLLVNRKHKELWYWKINVPILIYRIWGNIVFIIIGLRFTLVIFPDLFTWFFAIITLYDLAGANDFFKKPINLTIIFLLNVIFMVWAEIGHHGGDPGLDVGLGLTEIKVIFVGIWLFVLAIIKRKKKFPFIWEKYFLVKERIKLIN